MLRREIVVLQNILTTSPEMDVSYIDPKLREHWNRKLARTNALAPVNSLKKGEVTTESYQAESEKLGMLGATQAKNEIDILSESLPTFGMQIVTLGIGLMRDWSFVKKANQLGMSVLALDVSDYACEMADRFFASQVLPPGVENRVMQMDINQRLGANCSIEFLEPEKSYIIYAAQFLQVLQGKHRGEERAKRLLFGLSRFLELENRRVVMVHLLPEDNPQRKNPRVGESIMYPLGYILPPLSGSMQSRQVQILRMQKGMFYDDTYSAFTLVKR